MQSLANRRIILGITGSIAAYKSCELIRLWKKAGAEVRVVLSTNAEKFVTPITLHSLSGNPVLRSLGTNDYDLNATAHIDLAQWGEILVIAPATANFIAKMRYGICDDALLTESLAFRGPILLAPAMNTRMWEAVPTKENISALLERGIKIIGPDSGDLACGEVGAGKMSEPESIFSASNDVLQISSQNLPADFKKLSANLKGKKVLITAGPTREYIDAVRFISNRSSGKMGVALANAAAAAGADVVFVYGPLEVPAPSHTRIQLVPVETGKEMLQMAQKFLAQVDIVVAAAAVADYQSPAPLAAKMPRACAKIQLDLIPTEDVIGTLAKQKRPEQVFIGFAAEYGVNEESFAKAEKKLRSKNLDILVFNDISRNDIGFSAEDNEVWLFRKNAPRPASPLPKQKKINLANELFQL
jgi:phosphopantothenoylcysteine decarboxylase/phosphopantothenate--cysteine ligase